MASPADAEKLTGRVIAGVVGGAGSAIAWGGLVTRLTDGSSSGIGDTAGGMAALLVWIGVMILAFVSTSALSAWRILLLISLLPIIGLAALRGGILG